MSVLKIKFLKNAPIILAELINLIIKRSHFAFSNEAN